MLGNKLLEEQVALRITSIHLVTRLQQQHTGNYTNVLSGKRIGFHTGELLKSDIWVILSLISISKKVLDYVTTSLTSHERLSQ